MEGSGQMPKILGPNFPTAKSTCPFGVILGLPLGYNYRSGGDDGPRRGRKENDVNVGQRVVVVQGGFYGYPGVVVELFEHPSDFDVVVELETTNGIMWVPFRSDEITFDTWG
jgi:hypothetical protein